MTTELRQNQYGTFSKHCKMAMDEHQLFEMALAATIEEFNLSFPRKEEQKTVLKAFLCKDVFAVLPTGYGMSLIYRLAPLVA